MALILGLWRSISYGITLGIHAVATLASWKQIIDPWGLVSGNQINHLFVAAIPVLGTFIALYMLLAYDQYSLNAYLAKRR